MKKPLIILATHSLPSQLEIDIDNSQGFEFIRWKGIPKALLPISSKPALSWTLEKTRHLFPKTYVVTNAHNYHYYERWASGVGLPKANVINCGISSGPLEDIKLVGRVKKLKGDVVIMSCDAFYPANDHMDSFWSMLANDDQPQCGIHGIFCASLESIDCLDYQEGSIQSSITAESSIEILAEHFYKYAPYDAKLFDLKVNYLPYELTLDSYLQHWISLMNTAENGHDLLPPVEPITSKAYARVGLMGNPSDGFFGKTISLLISNFWAQVTLIPNDIFRTWPLDQGAIEIIHKPAMDGIEYAHLSTVTTSDKSNTPKNGDNGDNLLLACCKVFYRYCKLMGIPLNTRMGFQLLIDTNIPRQVGLAGSSAIITACWRSLMSFYGVTSAQIPPEIQANLVLSVEVDELGIAAGLQDRVIQTYGGLVYMDFDRTLMRQIGRGRYMPLDMDLLPPLYLAYMSEPEDSGKVHSNVKTRFQAGDHVIIQAMKEFASLAEKAREALEKRDYPTFARLMTMNFDLRRKTYGDSVVGDMNLTMVKTVRRHGGYAKFSGSGGAIVIFMPEGSAIKPLQYELEKKGCVFIKLTPMGSQI